MKIVKIPTTVKYLSTYYTGVCVMSIIHFIHSLLVHTVNAVIKI